MTPNPAAGVDRQEANLPRRIGGWLIPALGRDVLFAASVFWVVLIAVLAIFGSSLTPHDPSAINLTHRLVPPMNTRDGVLYVAGTDQVGRDFLSQLIIATRLSVAFGFISAGIATFFGLLAGSAAGYVGGRTDMVVTRIVDAWIAFPTLLLIVLIVVSLGPSVPVEILVLSLGGWPVITRLSRGLALEIRQTAYVESARALNAPTVHIVRRHVIPNLLTPVIVFGSLLIATLMLGSAGLDFLGLGIQPPDTSWGLLVAMGRDNIQVAWWLIVLPGLAIFLTTFAVNLVAITSQHLLKSSGTTLRGLLRSPMTMADELLDQAAAESNGPVVRVPASTVGSEAGQESEGSPWSSGDAGAIASGVHAAEWTGSDSSPGSGSVTGHESDADLVVDRRPRITADVDGAREPDAILAVENLSVDFYGAAGVAHAVRGVSWAVRPGKSLAIVGESGSGKSATVKAIMGILDPTGAITTGRILVKGQDILTLSPSKRRKINGRTLAFVQQDAMAALDPVMTVGAHLEESIRAHNNSMKRDAVTKRALELMERVGIPDPTARYRQYPFQFSGGMSQRILIAMAIANEPEVLIADEPTTALDVTIQAQIMDLLVSLGSATGMSLVLITHDLALVSERTDDILVMYGGIGMETGSVAQVLGRPGNPYTQALLEARPDVSFGRTNLTPIPGTPPNASRLPAGCPFNPRCKYAIDVCRATISPAIELAPGHESTCHRAQEVYAA